MQFEIDREKLLGRGAFANVFAGTLHGRPVAIKRMVKEDANELDDREEAAMRALQHAHVVQLLDVFQDDHFKYIVMELCDATLDDYYRGKYRRAIPPDADALYQMADGLAYIHSIPLVHRDLKPANILIKSSLLKIADFGYSKPASQTGSFSMSVGTKGTKDFLAPEMLMLMEADEAGGSPDGPRRRGSLASDVFSLGCLFFTVLTNGRHPFLNGSRLTIAVDIIEGRQNLAALDDRHSFAKGMIEAMIQPVPERRPQLDAVKQHLQSYIGRQR